MISRAAIVLVVFLCLKAVCAAAETLTIHGLPFKLDSLQPVDDKSVKVEVAGEAKLVSRDRVNDFVVRRFLGRNGLRSSFEPPELKTFISNSIDEGQVDWAELALTSMLETWPTELSEQWLEEIAAKASGLPAFRSALLNIQSSKRSNEWISARGLPLGVMVLEVGISDLAWLRAHSLGAVYTAGKGFRSYIQDRFNRSARGGDLDRAALITSICADLFGSEDELAQRLQGSLARLEKVREVAQSGKVEALYPLIEEGRQDYFYSQVFYYKVAEELEQKARQLLNEGKPSSALQVISRLDPPRHTPSIHEITENSLKAIKASEGSVLLEFKVDELLKILVLSDQNIRSLYIAVLANYSIWCTENCATIAEGDRYFERLLLFQPDPNPFNDEVRMKQALRLVEMGDRGAAYARIAGIRTGISLTDKMRLAFAGLYFASYTFFTLLFLFIASAFGYIAIQIRKFREWRRKTESRKQKAAKPAEPQQEKVKEDPFLHHSILDPRHAEYLKCLSVLGLGNFATLTEIKKSFRDAMKVMHPDVQGGQEGRASGRFMELNQAYQRILDLRKAMGMPDD